MKGAQHTANNLVSMKKTTSLFLLVLIVSAAWSQRRMGTWQNYLSYSNAVKVAEADDKIFCATEGGLFYVDYQDNSLNLLSGINGLNDFGIRTIAYSSQNKVLVVAYKNGNIDLVFPNRVINLPDIKRKSITGDKTIYNILFAGTDAYLSCGFGVVAVNLAKQEIKDTYSVGPNGSAIPVFDLETDGDYLYAATAGGILQASLRNTNLLDYRNWRQITDIPHADSKFSNLAVFNNQLIAVYTPEQWSGDKIYIRRNNQWLPVFPEAGFVSDLQVNNNYLAIAGREEIFLYGNDFVLSGRINSYNLNGKTIKPVYPRSAAVGKNGSLWIADYSNGLVRLSGQKFEPLLPDGPVNNSVFSLTSSGEELWVAAGGRTDDWNNNFRYPAFQRFSEGSWSPFTGNQFPEMTGFFDIVAVAPDPLVPGHVFAGSWGGGVLEFQDNQLVKRFTNQNSILQTALPQTPDAPYVRIGGLAFDRDGTLWITNSETTNALVSLQKNGEWKSYNLTEVSGNQYNIGPIIVTSTNDKWIVVPRGRDLYVVNSDVSKKKQLPVTSYFNNGQQEIFNRMNDVYSIVEDQKGDIWVGTSKGVAVFSNPGRIWQDKTFYATQPSLELGDGLYHPLLEKETVTAMAVDGANRKWLGTKNAGVYLVSESGDREILHFTAENSPLLSNTITAIATNPKTGEVFFGTAEGLISYQGDAPTGEDDFSGVYVYPNPVRETYQGPIVITGLMKNSDVRITDISGNLVYQTKSLGKQAVWDGKTLNGKRAATGVYLIFCADQAGEKTHIAKLLFIR